MATITPPQTESTWYHATTDSESDEKDPLTQNTSSNPSDVPLARIKPTHSNGALRRVSLSLSRLIQLVAACAMLITNIIITIFAFIAYSKHTDGELCEARPIHQYLFTAGLHAAANVLFLSLFIIQILLKVCHTWQHSQHKRADRPVDVTSSGQPSSVQIIDNNTIIENKLRVYVNSDRIAFDGIGARYWLSCIETFLAALAFLQVGIAILGEVWLSGLGIIPVQPGMPLCMTSAPTMYRYSLYIALYELWIIPVMIVVIIYAFVTCCTPSRKH